MAFLIGGAAVSTGALPPAAYADVDAPALNAYARARLADTDGALDIAVANYRQAMAADPNNGLVAIRSYRQAIESGDMALALRSAHVLGASGVLPHDGTLLLVIDALGRKDWKAAHLLAGRLEVEQNFAFVAPILNSWISLGEGQYVPPVVDASSRFGGLARRYVDEHIAWQMLAQGKPAEALPSITQALSIATKSQSGLRVAFAARLAALGEKNAALALIPGDPPLYRRARADIARGARIPVPPMTPQQGIARLFARLSDDVSGEGTRMLALTLARLASFGDPGSAEYRLSVAARLQAAGYPEVALVEAGKVAPTNWYALAAADVRVDALVAQGKRADALTLAQTLTAWPDAGANQQLRLATILVDAGSFDAAVTAYRAAEKSYPDGQAPWSLYLLEGSALERSGRWGEAQAALARAQALAPEEPVVLNYLGYAQVERNQNVAQALGLLRKASAMRPDDPSITDSLGWAHYVSGDAASAVPVLERAAAAAPVDVTINEHLGDAYWAVGRRFEARYAWSAAHAFADGGDAARLLTKMRDGLPMAAAN